MTGQVYFIKPVGMDGPIKIGHSSYPPARLAALKTWSPLPLELVSSIPAPMETERAIHERFAAWHKHGEWFDANQDLTKLMLGIAAGHAIEDLVDLTKKTGRLPRSSNARSAEATIVGVFKTRVDRAHRFGSATRGGHIPMPADVRAILDDAGGYRRAYRALTPAEVARLEGYIADCRAPASQPDRIAS